MKTILISINSKYIHTNNAVRLIKANSSFDIDILEFTIKDSISHMVETINNANADVIGFSLYIWNITIFKQLIALIDTNEKSVILGGPEVSYAPFDYIDNPKVDYIIKGEGELAFSKLLKAIKEDTSKQEIEGITFFDGKKPINNPPAEIKDLSVIKSPHYFEFDQKHIPNKISYIESSRGCPYKCSYCLSSLEQTVRFFDPKMVEETILYLMKHGSKTIKFLDRTFNANKNTFRLFDFIIKNNNYKTVFQFEITGDTLDTSIIEYINEKAPKGLIRFEIGIQSTNTNTNLLVDRYQDNKKLFHNIKLIQDAGVIDLHLDLIAGLPKEDLTSFKKTFNEVFKLGALELQLGFLKMLKGTKIRREAEKYAYVYNEVSPYEIISNESLSEEEIAEIKLVEEMLDIHHNKGYFGKNMLSHLLSTESPYDRLKGIGKWYQKHNYSFKGYQITDVYQRFFEFTNDPHINNTLKLDYLQRSKIKPKIFWENKIDKDKRRDILEFVSIYHSLSINNLYKHTVITELEETYYVFYYQNHRAIIFTVKKKDITI